MPVLCGTCFVRFSSYIGLKGEELLHYTNVVNANCVRMAEGTACCKQQLSEGNSISTQCDCIVKVVFVNKKMLFKAQAPSLSYFPKVLKFLMKSSLKFRI